MKLFHADRDENQNCEIFIAAFQFNFEKVLPITLCRINRANSQQLGTFDNRIFDSANNARVTRVRRVLIIPRFRV